MLGDMPNSLVALTALVSLLPAQQREGWRRVPVLTGRLTLRVIQSLKLSHDTERLVMFAWADREASTVLRTADTLIKSRPVESGGYVLKYLATLEFDTDRVTARAVAVKAVEALTKRPEQLAQFVRLALYETPSVEEYRIALDALAPLARQAPSVAVIRIAHLRALLGCGKIREAVVGNNRIVSDIGGDPRGLRALANMICAMENGRSLAIVAKQALDLAAESLPEDRDTRMIRFDVLKRLMGCRAEATKLAEATVQKVPLDQLHAFVISTLMTNTKQQRFSELAVIGARRMLQSNSALSCREYNSIAAAFYCSGLLDEAIRYQEEASSNGQQLYRRNLAKYRAAKAERDAGGPPNKNKGAK